MCASEMALWNSRHVKYKDAISEYELLNKTKHHIFLFDIQHGQVSIREKPEFYTRDQFESNLETAFHSIPPWVRAAIMYRGMLREVAATACPEVDTVIAVDVGDRGMQSETAPLFGIAKTLGSRNVLLPHFEFIWEDYHENISDRIPYENKSLGAMFVGSTTGMEPITVEDVRNLAFQRLRSAVFFQSNPLVDFRLPQIVSCTPDAEQLLRGMGFGTGGCPFEEHFAKKFIISMDGMAGSCSRVSIALKSNCVLLKYDSPYIMHYFRHLVPWFHYIPISTDEDVNVVLEIERRSPGFFKPIANEGRRFFENYISKPQILHYTGTLLRMYMDSFDHSSPVRQVADAGWRAEAESRQQAPAALTGGRSMLSRSDVIDAFRAILDRDPENEQVIEYHAGIESIPELYRSLIESDEFRENFQATLTPPERPSLRLSLDLPPIEVQSQVSDAVQLAAILERVRTAWSSLGERDPYFSVCTDPSSLGAGIGQAEEEFYASGENDLRNLTSFAVRAGIDLIGRSCLELGCGVGRVTRWLAPLFRHVDGIDVSPGHLAIARQQLAKSGIDNVSLTHLTGIGELRQIFGYDAFFSVLVLQHNPPPLIAYMLMQLLTNLAPGGVGFFQVPTYAVGYSFQVEDYLSTRVAEETPIEMHVLPQRDVMKIVYGTGCRVLEVREDDSTGIAETISNTFFVEKPV